MDKKQEDFAQWLTDQMGDDWRGIVCGLTTRHYTDTTDIPNLGDGRCLWLILGWVMREWSKCSRIVSPWIHVDGDAGVEICGVGCDSNDEISEGNTAYFSGATLLDAIEAAARALPTETPAADVAREGG